MRKTKNVVFWFFNVLGLFLLSANLITNVGYQNLELKLSANHNQYQKNVSFKDEQQLNPNKFSDISIANGHIGVIVEDEQKNKNLSMWGNNDFGQIGNNSQQNTSLPENINFPDYDEGIVELSVGEEVSGAVVKFTHKKYQASYSWNELYFWGKNDNDYLNIHSKRPSQGATINTPLGTWYNDINSISNLSFGKNHYGFLGHETTYPSMHGTSKNRILLWGDNSKHQLGPWDESEFVRPTNIINSFPDNYNGYTMYELALGDYHSGTIVWNSNYGSSYKEKGYQLLLWGDDSRGQIGKGGNKTSNSVAKNPYVIQNFPDNNIKSFKQLTMGANHTGVVANLEDGNQVLYMWGDNQYGQVGNGKDQTTYNEKQEAYMGYESSVQKIALPESKIKFLRFNNNISSVVTTDQNEKDHLYVWGQNFDGTILANEPKEITLPFDKIKSIDISKENLAIVSEDEKQNNHIWIQGDNQFGQFGLGNQQSVEELKEITNQENKYIENVELVNQQITTPKSFSQDFQINFADDNGITANYVNIENLGYELTNLPKQASANIKWNSSTTPSKLGTLEISNLDPNHLYQDIQFTIFHKVMKRKFVNNLTWTTKVKYAADPPTIEDASVKKASITQTEATINYQVRILDSNEETFKSEVKQISILDSNMGEVIIEQIPGQVNNIISGQIVLANLKYNTIYNPILEVKYFDGHKQKIVEKQISPFKTLDNLPSDAPTISDFAFKQIDPSNHQILASVNLPTSKPNTYDLEITRVELINQNDQVIDYLRSYELEAVDSKILLEFNLKELPNNTIFENWKLKIAYKRTSHYGDQDSLTYSIPTFTTMDKYAAFEPVISNPKIDNLQSDMASFSFDLDVTMADFNHHKLTIEKVEIKNGKQEIVGSQEYNQIFNWDTTLNVNVYGLDPGFTYQNWSAKISYFNGIESETITKIISSFQTKKLRSNSPKIEIKGTPNINGNTASFEVKVDIPQGSQSQYQPQPLEFAIVNGDNQEILWSMPISPDSTQILWEPIIVNIENLKYNTEYDNLRFYVKYFDGDQENEVYQFISGVKTEFFPSLEPIPKNASVFNDGDVSLVSYSLELPISKEGYHNPIITKIQIIDPNNDKILGQVSFDEDSPDHLRGKIELSAIEDKIIYDNAIFKVFYNDGYQEKSVSRQMETFIGKNERKVLSGGAIAGITIGVAVAIIGVIALVVVRKKKLTK